MRLIFLLYALFGFVSLGYQVAWLRILTDWFGSTSLTFALVVANFIDGLGLGALCSRRTGNWIGQRLGLSDRLRVYGAIEVLVGLTALITVLVGAMPSGP